MLKTINISLTKKLLDDTKKAVKDDGFASVSEVIRLALREYLYPRVLTENGFSPRFEDATLKAAKEPISKSRTWDGVTPFTDFVLNNGAKKKIIEKKNGTNRIHPQI